MVVRLLLLLLLLRRVGGQMTELEFWIIISLDNFQEAIKYDAKAKMASNVIVLPRAVFAAAAMVLVLVVLTFQNHKELCAFVANTPIYYTVVQCQPKISNRIVFFSANNMDVARRALTKANIVINRVMSSRLCNPSKQCVVVDCKGHLTLKLPLLSSSQIFGLLRQNKCRAAVE